MHTALRCLGLLTILFSSSAVGAPVPKDRDSLEKKFGQIHDPKRLSEISYQEGTLEVKVSDRYEASAVALKNTIRVGKLVNGDFEATVAVKYTCSKDPLGDKVGGHLGGGLAAWESEEAYVLVNRHHWPSPGAENGSDWSGGFDVHGEGGGGRVSHGATCGEVPLHKATHVRLRRTGDTFITEESRDNKKTWSKMTESKHTLKKELQVGVAVFNITHAKSTITFSDFELKEGGYK